MRVEAPVAGAKGLMQRVDAKIRATLPRQARVTRTEGTSVWVKFLGDGANDPESKFPSTVAGVPPATMGWVITLGGRKGLFVATGIAMPMTLSTFGGSGGVQGSTSGTYPIASRSLTFTGLNPNRTYQVSGIVGLRTLGTSSRQFYPVFQAAGSSTVTSNAMTRTATTNSQFTIDSSVATVSPNESGEIVVTPAFVWVAGTVNCDAASITATVR